MSRTSLPIAAAIVLLAAAPVSAQQITFEEQTRATPVRVVKKICAPGGPPCFGPCVWFPSDHEVNFDVTARPSAEITKVTWVVFDEWGNPVSNGTGTIAADGKTAEGVASPAPGAILVTDCGTFKVYSYLVYAEMDFTDDPYGPSRSWRTFNVRLSCENCLSSAPLRPDQNGPHVIPWRFTAQDHLTQWVILNGTEQPQPATVKFASSVPWIVFEQPELEVTALPGEGVSLEIPLWILPGSEAGASGIVSMTVTPLLDPALARTTKTRVWIANPGEGSCELPLGSCFEPHAGGSCNDPYCCNTVCSLDPFCCGQNWDDLCVQTAQAMCASEPPSAN